MAWRSARSGTAGEKLLGREGLGTVAELDYQLGCFGRTS
jgi:hypothetical protein